MTHHPDQRWTAATKDEVTRAVLAVRDDESFLARFRSKIDTRNANDDDCDIWTGAMSDEGYGIIRVGGRGGHVVRAHRVAYILAFGAPDPTLFLDHVWPVCRYRFCVNEHHLEPVAPAENTRRGRGVGRAGQRAMRTAALVARDAWALELARPLVLAGAA